MMYGYHTCRNQYQPLDIYLGPFDRDERLDFVEHILNVLDESRFGWPGSNHLTPDLDYPPERLSRPGDDKPELFYDLVERIRFFARRFLSWLGPMVLSLLSIVTYLTVKVSGSRPTAFRLSSGSPVSLSSAVSGGPHPLARGSPI